MICDFLGSPHRAHKMQVQVEGKVGIGSVGVGPVFCASQAAFLSGITKFVL